MFDDPTFDGASYLDVGGCLLDAARERPRLGLALARDRDADAQTREWFVGTRLTDPAQHNAADVRFVGGAPPLAALARRIRRGEFAPWFEDVKAGVDSGRLRPVGARAEPSAKAATPVPDPVRLPLIELVTFEAAEVDSALRCRTTRR